MINRVVITDGAKKDLRRAPAAVAEKLYAWVTAVSLVGLVEGKPQGAARDPLEPIVASDLHAGERRPQDALKYFERTRGPLTLGRTLAAIRETEEASLPAVAKRLGVSRTHLWDVEQGQRAVSVERAARWAKALGWPARVFVALALQDDVNAAGLKLKVSVEAA